ncbi:MAG: LicD family protein [Clostridia bacterium]|nr:LicD family protein [Clostridia bacterium]
MSQQNLMDKQKAKVYLLYLLRKLYDITEANNIPIYSSGGTCLGMVRHKGMIPWDDDIDLMIFREDYDRLVALCERDLPHPLKLRTRQNDPYFYQEFCKLCIVDDFGKYTDLSIDIFPIDNSNPKRKLFRATQNFLKTQLYHIKMYKVSKLGYDSYEPDSFIKKVYLQLFSALLPLKTIDKWLLSVLTADKSKSDYVVNWGASYSYKKATYLKSAFGTPQKRPFENTYIWTEEHPEEILIKLYGKDYMTPPPKDKQTDHGVRDFTCSALDYEIIKKEVGM